MAFAVPVRDMVINEHESPQYLITSVNTIFLYYDLSSFSFPPVMARSMKNSNNPQNPQDDESDLSDLGETAAAPSSYVANQLSDRPSAAQLARFRSAWNFQPVVDALDHPIKAKGAEARRYFTKYFADDAMFRAQTLTTFEKWAELTDEDHRKAQMTELVALLHNRWGGHRGKGVSIGSATNNNEAKDKNLRADLKMLLRKWYGDVEDGEAEVEEEEEGEEAVAGAEETAEDATQGDPLTATPDQPPKERDSPRRNDRFSEDEEDPLQKRIDLVTAISDNWADQLTSIVPESAVPYADRTSPPHWPHGILKALHDLSEITKERDDEVQGVLAKEFESLKQHDLERALQNIKAVHSFFHSASDMTSTGAATTRVSKPKAKKKAVLGGKALPSPEVTTSTGDTPVEVQVRASTTVRSSTPTDAVQQQLTPLPTSKRASVDDLRVEQPRSKKARTHGTESEPPVNPAPANLSQNAGPLLSATGVNTSTAQTGYSSTTTSITQSHNDRPIISPAHLSDEDKLLHRQAVLDCRIANTELIEAEHQVNVARETRSGGYERGGGTWRLEAAVPAAEAIVQQKRREVYAAMRKIVTIVGL